MNVFVVSVERIAGTLLGMVALVTFGEAALRYAFNMQIPDAFAFAGMLQAVAVCWGIATATFEGRHITFDLIWETAGPAMRRFIASFSELATFIFFLGLSYMLIQKILSSYRSHETTNDLLLPLWPYVTLAFLGIACATVLALLRLVRGAAEVR